MLTFRYLLAVVAAVAATAAVAAAVLGMFKSNMPHLASAAASIVAGKAAHLDTPVAVRLYPANYTYISGRWVLTDRASPGATAVPVYVLGLGQCPQTIQDLLNKTYTREQRHGDLDQLRAGHAVGGGRHNHPLRRHLPLRHRLQDPKPPR
jgi:hypothetical protein